MKATLILANGSVFSGTSIGGTADRVCELVFNTSMTGYQELLTDPAYAGQGVVMSYPLVGNYGVNSEDHESAQTWVKAFVVRHLSPRGSNFRCEDTLNHYLEKHDITGIQGVDTRALTKILRSEGSMNAIITCAEHFNVAEVMKQLQNYKVEKVVSEVTRKETEVIPAQGEEKCRIAVLDCGVPNSVLACLTSRGCRVTVLPAFTAANEILSGGYDGVLLSPGPGDPAENRELIAEIKKLYDSQIPLFGIGLGHQLLALAVGGKTEKLPYGHRGGNIPVRDLEKGKVFITSQNHGYAVAADSVDAAVAQPSHINVNDGSVEGLKYQRPNCFTMQFNPEGNTGPMEVRYIFDRIVEIMGGAK